MKIKRACVPVVSRKEEKGRYREGERASQRVRVILDQLLRHFFMSGETEAEITEAHRHRQSFSTWSGHGGFGRPRLSPPPLPLPPW